MAMDSMAAAQNADFWIRPDLSFNFMEQSQDDAFEKIFEDFIFTDQMDGGDPSNRSPWMGNPNGHGAGSREKQMPSTVGRPAIATSKLSSRAGRIDARHHEEVQRHQPCRDAPISFHPTPASSPLQPQGNRHDPCLNSSRAAIISDCELLNLEGKSQTTPLSHPSGLYPRLEPRSVTSTGKYATSSAAPPKSIRRQRLHGKPDARQMKGAKSATKKMPPMQHQVSHSPARSDFWTRPSVSATDYTLTGPPPTLPLSPPPSAKLSGSEDPGALLGPQAQFGLGLNHGIPTSNAMNMDRASYHTPLSSPSVRADASTQVQTRQVSGSHGIWLPPTPHSAKSSHCSLPQPQDDTQWPNTAEMFPIEFDSSTEFPSNQEQAWMNANVFSSSSQPELPSAQHTPHLSVPVGTADAGVSSTSTNSGLGISWGQFAPADHLGSGMNCMGGLEGVSNGSVASPGAGQDVYSSSPTTKRHHSSSPASSRSSSPPSPRSKSKSRSVRRGKAASPSGLGFVNFTPSDSQRILTGVAPSGSSKTKARRDREAAERSRKVSAAYLRELRKMGVLKEDEDMDFV
ncbi:MAG: hypothetical protein M1833_005116 [Piccolia ochrophora]|nr:MAG: hypothetical protein M1833_005116 [Piccolia ochrophora]